MQIIPHLILRSGEKILLSRRAPSQKFWPNYWHCVSGSLEKGETPQQALLRETEEEIGISLEKRPELVATVALAEPSLAIPGSTFYCLALFFLADLPSDQIPINKEPLKQDGIDWFLELPAPIIPVVRRGIEAFMSNQRYVELLLSPGKKDHLANGL